MYNYYNVDLKCFLGHNELVIIIKYNPLDLESSGSSALHERPITVH